ncbi:flagellin N-terminal helical domain-containing protein [Anatilimnocola floriformis]|uniref:flagellin N-terminal helical domain-containing protein n=1 Tax=Anatilimnocola floriformis TaxID=2948575 RepID=UPI0020C4AF76|nr:flagellin [Anatilimnocola floriformis]
MSRINTNVSSLIAQKTLTRSNDQLQEALSRLSTGVRINSGKDDPAGLIASENLRRDITSSQRAISNTERATQLISTADSALGQISNLLNDVRGLVTEAANTGVLSDEQIAANQLQVDSSLEAIDRIAQVTTFQGRKLLDGSLDFIKTTTSGGSSLVDLNIQKANLGQTGSLSVAVDVTAAATRASVTTNAAAINYGPGAASSGSITLPTVTTPQSQAAGNLNLSGAAGQINIQAVNGGAAQGATGNATDVQVQAAANVAQATGNISLGNSGAVINVQAAAGGVADGTVGNAADVTIQAAAGIAHASGTLTLTNGSINISAASGSAAQGATGNGVTIVLTNSGASTTAAYDSGTNTLTIDVASAGDTISNISAAIDGTSAFVSSVATGGAGAYDVGDNSAGLTSVLSGGNNGTTSASYNAGTNLITVNAALGATVTSIASAINGLADFNATATFGGGNTYQQADNATNNNFLSGGNNGTTSVSYNSTSNLITVNAAVGATVGSIATAINGLADFNASATLGSGNSLTGADYTTTNNLLSGGANAVNANDVITITSNTDGSAFNGTLTFAANGSVPANGVSVTKTGPNITVNVNNTSTYNVDDLVTAIQGQLSGYTVSRTGSAGDGSFAAATETSTTTALTGGTNDTGTGLSADLVFKLSGASGSQVFTFAAGNTLTNIVDSINLVSDATGVAASISSGTLQLNSTAYGSNAFVDVDVRSEGTGGTFAAGLSSTRSTGSDIVATVNGTLANGNGNRLSINTSSLELNLTVADGSSTDVNFTISGGGAVFQLGPDVVSTQQARIGIGSVNTADLGGTNGRLFELRSGSAKDLKSDTTGAAKVVDEAINKVTSLRGRLGAFQRTTLETNIASLSDTLTNLTEAESSIRDADFAAESAKLTRAQILVQSGTSVLQIANQNPQQVLSLLRG